MFHVHFRGNVSPRSPTSTWTDVDVSPNFMPGKCDGGTCGAAFLTLGDYQTLVQGGLRQPTCGSGGTFFPAWSFANSDAGIDALGSREPAITRRRAHIPMSTRRILIVAIAAASIYCGGQPLSINRRDTRRMVVTCYPTERRRSRRGKDATATRLQRLSATRRTWLGPVPTAGSVRTTELPMTNVSPAHTRPCRTGTRSSPDVSAIQMETGTTARSINNLCISRYARGRRSLLSIQFSRVTWGVDGGAFCSAYLTRYVLGRHPSREVRDRLHTNRWLRRYL